MEEDLYLTNLYDYYGCLLTLKQQMYFEDYYFDNLTLEEIAENNNVSKNAISKSLIEVKEKLTYYENKLGLLNKKGAISKILNEKEYNLIEKYL